MAADKMGDAPEKQPQDKLEAAHNRPHFAIDWRQLTYYQKERGSGWFGFGVAEQRANEAGAWPASESGPKCEFESDVSQPVSSSASTTTDSVQGGGPVACKGRKILDGLDGSFKSGQLSAILGPSGAGKTTFLSALFGDKQEAAQGRTQVTWFRDAQHRKPLAEAESPRGPIRIAFLPQHDHLLHHLTVYETLMFASKIKNATRPGLDQPGARRRFHAQNVRRVAKMLKLLDCLGTRCGKLSGGQYKRVSIGQELLSEPDVIILDEPTSGLDAMTCLTTVRTLKSIVARHHPMSIVLTIHQPDVDVFNLFDQVYVIAQGGLAIYEGPPQGVAPALAKAGLAPPAAAHNPARLIVENAFVVGRKRADGRAVDEPASDDDDDQDDDDDDEDDDLQSRAGSSGSDDNDRDVDGLARRPAPLGVANFIRRSLLSLSEAFASSAAVGADIDLAPSGRLRESGRRPLLNIGVQTADGRLITSRQLESNQQVARPSRAEKRRLERYNLLRRLNEMQRSKYQAEAAAAGQLAPSERRSSAGSSTLERPASAGGLTATTATNQPDGASARSDYSSAARTATSSVRAASLARVDGLGGGGANGNADDDHGGSASAAAKTSVSMQTIGGEPASDCESPGAVSNDMELTMDFSAAFSGNATGRANNASPSADCGDPRAAIPLLGGKLAGATTGCSAGPASSEVCSDKPARRQFDKRLSAKHNCSRRKTDYPIAYHALLLTHRTWLSVVRDPVFFGIQFCMHTTIPILLALIFGSNQEEGCPRVGDFDLVEFAYSAHSDDFIGATIRSIRQSVGNIGVVFFEMFVLCFAINCITALVFPLDMFVLLKEHRNGWYSLRSYFFGRTLADLPLPVVLHSMAMTILYFMTGQPLSLGRFVAIIGLVIVASLVAQSVGLTIGALLMRSSQSAVLAAAAIVAPFFALSGFIVRIHTLPWVAQFFANASYLYHLLNGFIILRYGFERCPCHADDFEPNQAHQIPANIRTMASIWLGTYSDEYLAEANPLVLRQAQLVNKTQNIDPNIDLIEKLLNTFKSARSYGHQIGNCNDVIPYAMLDFNLRDQDIYWCTLSLVIMLFVSRFITFSAIYYKIRSVS